jgi:hypothetical protein
MYFVILLFLWLPTAICKFYSVCIFFRIHQVVCFRFAYKFCHLLHLLCATANTTPWQHLMAPDVFDAVAAMASMLGEEAQTWVAQTFKQLVVFLGQVNNRINVSHIAERLFHCLLVLLAHARTSEIQSFCASLLLRFAGQLWLQGVFDLAVGLSLEAAASPEVALGLMVISKTPVLLDAVEPILPTVLKLLPLFALVCGFFFH